MSQFPLPRILEFIKRVAPFETLSPEELGNLVSKMDIAYYPRGEEVIKAGDAPSEALFIIQSGSVKLSVPDEDGQEMLIDIRGEGDTFGALSLMQGKQALLNVTVKEDLIAFILPDKYFLDMVGKHQAFKRHFSFSLARRFRAVRDLADKNLGQITGIESLQVMAVQMRSRVSELMSTQVLTCSPEATIQQIAQDMARRRVGSIVVQNGNREPLGMITDTDLRCRVLAIGLEPSAKVTQVMSSPIMTIPPKAFAFEAMLEMALHGVHHLVVAESGQMVGVLSDHDIKMITGASPVGMIKKIEKLATVEHLSKLAKDSSQVLAMLIRMGSSAEYMMTLLNEFYDRLTLRLLKLSEEDMKENGWGPVPCAYSWMYLGTPGRCEQAPPPRLEHALLYQDVDVQREDEAHKWFLELARRMDQALSECGLLKADRGISALDPQWCKSLTGWQVFFESLVSEADPENLSPLVTLFDFRPVEGVGGFAERLRDKIFRGVKENPGFLHRLSRLCLASQPPLGFLRQFLVERDGGYSETLSLDKRILHPLVGAVRVLSLEAGIHETSTLERITQLEESEVIDERMAADLKEAFSFVISLLISRFLEAQVLGQTNYYIVDPGAINSAQRKMLKESFTVVGSLCNLLLGRYEASRRG